MRTRWSRALAFAGLVAGSGCTVFQGIVAESLGVPLETKAVAYKQGTQELIATDGTWCLVSRGKFEDVEVGDAVQCTWSSDRPPESHGS